MPLVYGPRVDGSLNVVVGTSQWLVLEWAIQRPAAETGELVDEDLDGRAFLLRVFDSQPTEAVLDRPCEVMAPVTESGVVRRLFRAAVTPGEHAAMLAPGATSRDLYWRMFEVVAGGLQPLMDRRGYGVRLDDTGPPPNPPPVPPEPDATRITLRLGQTVQRVVTTSRGSRGRSAKEVAIDTGELPADATDEAFVAWLLSSAEPGPPGPPGPAGGFTPLPAISTAANARLLAAGDAYRTIVTTSDEPVIVTIPATLGTSFRATFVQKGAGQIHFWHADDTRPDAPHGIAATAGKGAAVDVIVVSNVGGNAAVAALTGNAARPSDMRPNVILTYGDDWDYKMFDHMPEVRERIAAEGVVFSNWSVPMSLCGPDRVSLLTGVYPHNNQSWHNRENYDRFYGPANTPGSSINQPGRPVSAPAMMTWRADGVTSLWDKSFEYAFADAGYDRLLVGKLLNGYGTANSLDEVVGAGWTESYLLSGNALKFYDYAIDKRVGGGPAATTYYGFLASGSQGLPVGALVPYTGVGGVPARYVTASSDAYYSTDVMVAIVLDFLDRHKKTGRPVLVVWCPNAAHEVPMTMLDPAAVGVGGEDDDSGQSVPPFPAPRHEGLLASQALPMDPNFNEADMADKPDASHPNLAGLLTAGEIAALEVKWRARGETVMAVSEGVASISDKLEQLGLRSYSFEAVSADNGYFLGQHRETGKVFTYDAGMRAPLALRGPGVPKGIVRDQLAMTCDLTATFHDILGAPPPIPADGRSLLPLIADAGAPWRTALLWERRQARAVRTKEFLYLETYNGQDPTKPVRYYDLSYLGLGGRPINPPDFGNVSSRELYSLDLDPWQMEGRLDTTRELLAQPKLAALLAAMRAAWGEDLWFDAPVLDGTEAADVAPVSGIAAGGEATVTAPLPIPAPRPWWAELYIDGVSQTPGVDFTANGGATLTLIGFTLQAGQKWRVHFNRRT